MVKASNKAPKKKWSQANLERVKAMPAGKRRALVMGSAIKGSSTKQYGSRIRGLTEFLREFRESEGEVEVTSITESEFEAFLTLWFLESRASPGNFRAALGHEYRMAGMKKPEWLSSKDMTAMIKGAGSKAVRREKGVLSEEQVELLRELIVTGEGDHMKKCRGCRQDKGSDLGTTMEMAMDLMLTAPLRPHNVKDMKPGDYRENEMGRFLYIPHCKTEKGIDDGKWIEIGGVAGAVFLAAAERSGKGYVFPRCVMTHLNKALKYAANKYGWDQGLVWSPHCLRHTHVTMKRKKVIRAVTAHVCDMSVRTARIYSEHSDRKRK